MQKKPSELSLDDCRAIADQLDAHAATLEQSGEAFTRAARAMRMLIDAVSRVDCTHMIKTTVTSEMSQRGIDARAAGTYCMTCGELIELAKPKKESAQ